MPERILPNSQFNDEQMAEFNRQEVLLKTNFKKHSLTRKVPVQLQNSVGKTYVRSTVSSSTSSPYGRGVAANYIIQTEKKEHRAQISGQIGASTGSVKLKLGAKGTSSVPSYDDISQNLLAPLPLSSKNSLISCRSVFQNSDEEEPSNEHNRIIKKTLSRKKAATISDKEELTKNKPQPLSGTVSVGPINSHQANEARKEARKEAAYATTDMGIGIIGCYNPLTRRYRQHSIDNKQPKKKLLRACNSYWRPF